MVAAIRIGLLDLRRRVRDRSVLINAFVAPIALAMVLGFAFGTGNGTLVHVGVVDLDHTSRSSALINAGIAAAAFPAQVSVVRVDSAAQLHSEVSSGLLGGGIIVPSGWGAATLGPEAVTASMAAAMLPASPGPSQVVLRSPALVEIVYPRNSTIAAGVTAALTAAVDGRVAAGELAAAAAGTSAASAGDIATQAAETPPPLKAVDDSAGKRPNTIGYFGPGMAIIFLFIGAGAGARSLLGERDTGTLARLAIAPVRPASVIAGKVGAVVLTALASILAVWGVTTLVFSATWGQPAAVLAMCVATVLAFAGLALFIAVAAKTPGQAETATLVLGFGLALFGGNFFPPGTLPPLFEKLTLLTPNGWALQGFGSLAIDGAHFPTVVTPLIVLVVIAAAFGVVSLARLPKAFAA